MGWIHCQCLDIKCITKELALVCHVALVDVLTWISNKMITTMMKQPLRWIIDRASIMTACGPNKYFVPLRATNNCVSLIQSHPTVKRKWWASDQVVIVEGTIQNNS